MRYTEARLKKFAEEVYLKDLDKTVDFVANYDETEKEPEVLPVRVPNLLVNGAEGIAVGMSTSIPTGSVSPRRALRRRPPASVTGTEMSNSEGCKVYV